MRKQINRIRKSRRLRRVTENRHVRKVTQNKEAMQFIRFCIVGGTCAVIDAVIFYIVLHICNFYHVQVFAPYQIALVSGYVISLCVNYYLTVRWTFRVSASKRNAAGIVMAHMFNLFVVRMGLMWIFVDTLGIPDKWAYLPMAVISAITNYLVVKFAVNKTSR